MFLYTEAKEKVRFKTSPNNKLGGKMHGNVYQISDDTCLKVYKRTDDIDLETLKLIKHLKLKNYYQIYDFYFDQDSNLKAHTMKYYKNEEIDILTTETSYTLNNLLRLLSSVKILNQNHILISDLHSENVILGKDTITVIDTDLYSINRFFKQLSLEMHNLNALKCLFESLYTEALEKYHPEYDNHMTQMIIKDIFKLYGTVAVEDTCRSLSQYKYPIDYLKKRIR